MKKVFVVSGFYMLTAFAAIAQEGMWMFNQLGQLDVAETYGGLFLHAGVCQP